MPHLASTPTSRLYGTTLFYIGLGNFAAIATTGYSSAGPAIEAPSNLSIVRRVAYYTFHRRFWDYFVPYTVCGAMMMRDLSALGVPSSPFWAHCVWMCTCTWAVSAFATADEAYIFRDRPYTEEEERQWVKGMTRAEFMRRKGQ